MPTFDETGIPFIFNGRLCVPFKVLIYFRPSEGRRLKFFSSKIFQTCRRLRHILRTNNENIFSLLFDWIFSSNRGHMQHTNIMLPSVRRKLHSQCDVCVRPESNIKILLSRLVNEKAPPSTCNSAYPPPFSKPYHYQENCRFTFHR